MRDLDDGSAVGGPELLAESGVGDCEIAADVEGILLAREERQALTAFGINWELSIGLHAPIDSVLRPF